MSGRLNVLFTNVQNRKHKGRMQLFQDKRYMIVFVVNIYNGRMMIAILNALNRMFISSYTKQ